MRCPSGDRLTWVTPGSVPNRRAASTSCACAVPVTKNRNDKPIQRTSIENPPSKPHSLRLLERCALFLQGTNAAQGRQEVLRRPRRAGTSPIVANETFQGHFHASLPPINRGVRSEEHTSELQSLMRISYAVFCL